MMHRNDFVVCLRPAGGGATYREYKLDGYNDTSDTRTRKINIPFNQEYEFVFKNMAYCRRSVTISIDGDEIGSWVISGGSKANPYEATLERFLDSDRKFKALSSTDGGVADPSNPDNGKIEVKVVDEFQSYHMEPLTIIDKCYLNAPATYDTYTASCSTGSSSPLRATNINYSNVATGEGSASNQTFITTSWNGDVGAPMYFIFRLHGVDRKVTNNHEYCHECGTKLASGAKFCHSCGTSTAMCA